MKKLVLKFLIFCIPFAVAVVFFFAFETSDYWQLKGDAEYLSKPLSSTRELLLTQPANILLGDSRMANLNVDYIEQVSGTRYAMLAFGGASLNESIDIFWYSAQHTKLEKVVLGLNFYTINGNHSSDRFKPLIKTAENPLVYMSDVGYWLGAINSLKMKTKNMVADITNRPELREEAENPSLLRESSYQPSDTVTNGYRTDMYEYAQLIDNQTKGYGNVDLYLTRLREISDYCDENGIELSFVLFNGNRAIWDMVVYPKGIDVVITNYKAELKTMGTLYDFEWDNEFARNDDNFLDGFHFPLTQKLAMSRIIFADEQSEWCVVTKKQPTPRVCYNTI